MLRLELRRLALRGQLGGLDGRRLSGELGLMLRLEPRRLALRGQLGCLRLGGGGLSGELGLMLRLRLTLSGQPGLCLGGGSLSRELGLSLSLTLGRQLGGLRLGGGRLSRELGLARPDLRRSRPTRIRAACGVHGTRGPWLRLLRKLNLLCCCCPGV